MSVMYHEGKFPPRKIDWERLARPLEKAVAALSRYDSFLGIIPNSSILISPLMTQEAVTSSKIEGTRATASDVLMFEAGGDEDLDPTKRNDIREVLNYQVAVSVAEEMLRTVPLSGRVLRAAHAQLLQGVRGQFKSPGKYRVEQNWIGSTNDIAQARYVPVSAEGIPNAMYRWEGFVNGDGLPSLIKISIAHAEFESIHPFLDGNGRIGRMLIPLMLCEDGILSHPCFYLSEFFEHRNVEYQDRLLAVSAEDDWTGWCEFFLTAMFTQAAENERKAREIFALYEETRNALLEVSKSAYSDRAVETLFHAAIFKSTAFAEIDGISPKTGRRLLGNLKEMGVVTELHPARGRRPAVLVFPKLLEITEDVRFRSES